MISSNVNVQVSHSKCNLQKHTRILETERKQI